MPKLCEFENCRHQSTYGEFYGKPIRCNLHKEEYKLVSRLCQEGNCSKRSSYNYNNEIKAIYCSTHKLDNMIDIVSKKCEYDSCNILPIYNYEGETTRRFCKNHKLDGMIDIKSKKCEYDECHSRAFYNYKGIKHAKYCNNHKLEGMINVTTKKCEYEGCYVTAHFNYKNENQSKYCTIHKLEGMINVISKNCEFENCDIQPCFNYKGKKQGRFCSNHKMDGMINVKDKTCEYETCNILPSYNYNNEISPRFCVNHKLEGMINLKANYCEFETCNKQPNYNYVGEIRGRFCTTHKLERMIDVKTKKCKANFCLGTKANIKYKGYCCSCFQHLFPNDPLSFQIRSKTKEIAVRDYINSIFTDFQHDTPLWTGNCDCTHRRRIDHRKLIGNTLLCIETDEHQHKSYDKANEEIRYDDLFMLHGGKFIYIRFNPDKFKKNGKSCNPMVYTRLLVLKEEIERQINRIENEENTELLEIIKLFYDE